MSKTIEAVAPSVKNGNAKKSRKKAIQSYLSTDLKGTNVLNANLPENVKGAQIEKVKRQLSALQSAKIEANNSHKAHIFEFTFNLNSFKVRGAKYLSEFNAKNGTKVTMKQVTELTAPMLCAHMTDKDKERQKLNGNKWQFWMLENLIAKHFAPTKVAKVKKPKK
jgi:hypothetical protein